MVLDTINDNDELVFKNTHGNNKKYKLRASDPRAPDEFYFIHIEPINNQIRTSSSSSSQSPTSSSDDLSSSQDSSDSEAQHSIRQASSSPVRSTQSNEHTELLSIDEGIDNEGIDNEGIDKSAAGKSFARVSTVVNDND